MPKCQHCDRTAISVDQKRCARHLTLTSKKIADGEITTDVPTTTTQHITGYTTTDLSTGGCDTGSTDSGSCA